MNKNKKFLQLLMWYECVVIVSGVIMALGYAYRTLSVWVEFAFFDPFSEIMDSFTFKDYMSIFVDEILAGVPALLFLCVLAAIAAYIHTKINTFLANSNS